MSATRFFLALLFFILFCWIVILQNEINQLEDTEKFVIDNQQRLLSVAQSHTKSIEWLMRSTSPALCEVGQIIQLDEKTGRAFCVTPNVKVK